jgi:hypothetical protein
VTPAPVPTKATLARYGITADEWRAMYASQNGRCAACARAVDKLVVDHEHVRGWKQMPADRRRLYVRGLLCIRCNWRFLPVGLTGAIAGRIATYLAAYEARSR